MKYICEVCGYVYDPAVGDPDGGIAAGTAFENIPDDWVCPICGHPRWHIVATLFIFSEKTQRR